MRKTNDRKQDKIAYGDIVRSLAGHDEGTVYFVTATDGRTQVLVSDGKLHKLSSPKRKNVKHLERLEVEDSFREAVETAASMEFGADKRLKKLLREAEMPLQTQDGDTIRKVAVTDFHKNWRD